MKRVSLLDCTLRDGGYVNDWRFGQDTVRGFIRKITQTGIEFCEVGFIGGDTYDPEKSIFPDSESFRNVIQEKHGTRFVGMVDMKNPVPLERFSMCDGSSIDGVRIIFKRDKMDEAYGYCRALIDLGYLVFVNFVETDMYSDSEFIEGIRKFNELKPYAISIVDTFGLIKRKQFLRLVYIADNNMDPDIMLCYHGHNNLQQAFGNAEALVELNLRRNVCIDACVFGMGRGAGNLCLELFADFMNENYDTDYRIEPMLEIMDEYLNGIFKSKFWGYSVPLYLSAVNRCHPNYAIHLAKKNTLTVTGFNELLKGMSQDDRTRYSEEVAEKYYRKFQDDSFDDSEHLARLRKIFAGRDVVLLAPGKTILKYQDEIASVRKNTGAIYVAVNFDGERFDPDFIFISNVRRTNRIGGKSKSLRIVTSNMKDLGASDYVLNFAGLTSGESQVFDNSGLMALNMLAKVGAGHVFVAGMDGYSTLNSSDYYDGEIDGETTKLADAKNSLISMELKKVSRKLQLTFITPTFYSV